MGYARYGEDPDAYWGRMERDAEKNPRCCVCDRTMWDGDECYLFESIPFGGHDVVCPDCLKSYLRDRGHRASVEIIDGEVFFV